MRREHYPAIAALVALLLGGCVAEYKRISDETFSAAPDLSAACQFQWTAGRAYYRLRDFNGFGWGDADQRGNPGLQRYLKEITPQCPHAAGAPRALLSTHYVDYTNMANRGSMMLPVAYFQTLTFGYAPMEMSNYYAACVETDTLMGPRRAAIAHGRLESMTNVWGASDSVLHAGAARRQQNREQLLRDLTLQAWHKLWTPGQGLAPGAGCRETIDAFVK